MLNTYRVPEYNFPKLKRKLNALVKRAGKLGLPALEWTDDGKGFDAYCRTCYKRRALGPFCDCGRCTAYMGEPHKAGRIAVRLITISGDSPKLNGWSLVAVLEAYGDGVMVSSVPGVECPAKYRKADPAKCDHCKTDRRRKQTFVVANENGKTKQVGRSCIKDFLGHDAPDSIGAFYAAIFETLKSLGSDDEDLGSYGGRDIVDLDIVDFLSMTAACVAEYGWTPRSKSDGNATADAVWHWLTVKSDDLKPSERAKRRELIDVSTTKEELAAKAIEWAKALDARSDYEHNVKLVASAEYVSAKAAGLAASIVPGYLREVEQEVLNSKRATESAHVGTVGEREVFELSLVSVRGIGTDYGVSYLHKFVDRDGNDLTWWSSSAKWGTEGDDWTAGCETENVFRSLRATVKKHDSFKGVSQTTITRAFEVKAS